MADGSSGGGNTFLAFVLGGVVMVLVVAFFAFGGAFDTSKQVDVKIEAPKVDAPKPGGQ